MRITGRIGCVAAMLLVAQGAVAGPLPTDPAAYLTGTQAYSVSMFGASLKANVEYAVYKPGQFSTSAALGLPADPSGGAQYVYAYQVFNDQGGNQSFINLNVGFSGGNELPANIGTLGPVFGQLTSSFEFIPAGNPKTAAEWDYSGANVVAVGAHTTILLYTSPYSAEFDNGGIQGGLALAQQKTLPSPIPEPVTAVLALVGFMGLLLPRFLRRAQA